VGRWREAVDHYEYALRLSPDMAETHANLGNALVRLDRLPEAISQFEEALRLNPRLAPTHRSLGEALVHSGRLPEAISQFEEALRLNPRDDEARADLERARWPAAAPAAGATR
jgi:tetratricopeptide (TPR) repeat protein